jgi:hypothetical protein
VSRTTSHRRQGFPILGLCGVLLLAAGVAAVAQVSTCINCNCYFATDCKCPSTEPWACSYTGCKVWNNGGKLVDGHCVATPVTSAIAAGERSLAAQALDSWLQAYEQAAWRGGEPDEALIASAVAVPLTPAQHAVIRQAVLDTQVRLFGLAGESGEQRGAFVLPTAEALCPATAQELTQPLANGALKKLPAASAGVARIVREAMVAELLEPYHSNFEQLMDRIPREFPNYTSTGPCGAPAASAPHFPFANGLDCLKQETLAGVHALLAAGGHDGVSLQR